MKNGGGHFAPELGGHFELESGAHFKLELGGQYHWNLHTLTNRINSRLNFGNLIQKFLFFYFYDILHPKYQDLKFHTLSEAHHLSHQYFFAFIFKRNFTVERKIKKESKGKFWFLKSKIRAFGFL